MARARVPSRTGSSHHRSQPSRRASGAASRKGSRASRTRSRANRTGSKAAVRGRGRGKAQGGRRRRDGEGRPRGRSSAYMFYVQQCWKAQRSPRGQPGKVNFTKFTKQCSETWCTMNPEDKQKYEEMSKLDKLRYDSEMSSYREAEAKRKASIPKRPLGAYMLFCHDERPQVRDAMPEAKITEIGKELGRRWRACLPHEKARYIEMATAEKIRYQRQTGKMDTVSRPGSRTDGIKADSSTDSLSKSDCCCPDTGCGAGSKDSSSRSSR